MSMEAAAHNVRKITAEMSDPQEDFAINILKLRFQSMHANSGCELFFDDSVRGQLQRYADAINAVTALIEVEEARANKAEEERAVAEKALQPEPIPEVSF